MKTVLITLLMISSSAFAAIDGWWSGPVQLRTVENGEFKFAQGKLQLRIYEDSLSMEIITRDLTLDDGKQVESTVTPYFEKNNGALLIYAVGGSKKVGDFSVEGFGARYTADTGIRYSWVGQLDGETLIYYFTSSLNDGVIEYAELTRQ